MSKLKVAILGGGISAAYINYACFEVGIEPYVLSQAKTDAPAGCFWLWNVPKSIHVKSVVKSIQIQSVGSKLGYVVKQWGDISVNEKSSSFPEISTIIHGYNPKRILPLLWQNTQVVLSAEISDERAYDMHMEYDIVFKTFPHLCDVKKYNEYIHLFPIVSYNGVKATTNLVTYNGIIDDSLVRFSILFGKAHYEFAQHTVIEPHQYKYGKLGMTKDLHPKMPEFVTEVTAPNIYLIGRYAQFKRHMLAHEAYKEAIRILETYNA